MRKIEWKFRGHTFYLCLNAAALTEVYARYGEDKSFPELYAGTGRAEFSATCVLLALLAEQGELVRRYEGHDRGPILGADYFRAQLTPRDLAGAKRALGTAYDAAFRRETEDEDEEVDLVLLELQKKTKALRCD